MKRTVCVASIILATSMTNHIYASEVDVAERVSELENQLRELTSSVEKASRSSADSSVMGSKAHLTGYADIGFEKQEGGSGSFNTVRYAPIFHYGFSDKLLFEAELELLVDENGETELTMEYADFNIVVNDSLIIQVGQFLSPIGQFRQNIHPAWINKLPSAPLGFGHGGAAPISEVGVQARGGMILGGMRSNYAVFYGNGPRLVSDGGGHGLELDTEGTTGDIDDGYSFGGRFGLLPLDTLELGVSYMGGAADYLNEDGDPRRADLNVVGADFVYHENQFSFRGEYIKTEIDSAEYEPGEPEDLEWEAWYLQGSYRFGDTPYEGVIRYGDYEPSESDAAVTQAAIGVNYLLAPQSMVKIAWEFNDAKTAEGNDDDRLLVQLAHGF
ncbi:MAG: hypothetical protein OQK12_11810 [Motiliproteus sp.]|nr:hypothetical protein [Motiliproteus sp.]MCW9051609.1 hypothetical protein [Motiliproteus sp.]